MSRKDIKPVLKRLRSQGFDIDRAKNGHYQVARGGRKVQIAYSPSDPRTLRNIESRLRRIGYVP